MAKNDTPEIPGLFDDLPKEAPQEQIAKISLRSWRTHLASIRTLDRRIEKLIDEAVKQALAQGRKLTSADIGRVFQRHPELRAALDKTMQQLNDDLTTTIEQGSKEAWLRANTAADAVVAAMANNNAQLAALLNAGDNKPQNDRALRAFQQREMQGLKLSDRVWRATEGMKLDMERAIELALAEGVPAQKLSQRVRELLREPHRLYRRVRDKDGNLKLSQAAQKYHPGTGVYRSSYKNAMRVARTEVNMAYQASDSERWTRSWWVKGIRVSLSNNHTCLDSKGRPAPLVDICDELAGDYPADFKFTGWHPQCRCFATAITCEYTDIRDYYRRKRAGEDMTDYTPPGTITEPPEQFKRWMADNSDRLAGAAQRGTTPYFIANNAKYTDPNWKPGKAAPAPAPRPKTPLEIADERHARRTPGDVEKIQEAWSRRQLNNLWDGMTNGTLPKQAQSRLDELSEHITFGEYAEFNDKAAPLLSSMRRHAARTAKEGKIIRATWDLRRIENMLPGIQDPDLKAHLEAHLPAAKAALKAGKPGMVIPLRARIMSSVSNSFQHTFAARATAMADQSPAFKEAYDKLFKALDNNDPITACQQLPTVRAKAATLTRWNLRKWGCVDRTFTFEGVDTDRIIYKGSEMTTKAGEKVVVNTLQQDLLKFKDSNGVTYYYTLGIEEANIRYKALEASKLLAGKPKYIRENLQKGIIFTDRAHPLDKFYQKEYKNFRKGAMYSGDPVTVHTDYTQDPDGFNFSICHEIGHHIDHKIGWRRNTASQAAWKQAQTDDVKFYREYGKNDTSEDFADSISLYTILTGKDRKRFESQFPHRAAIIKKILAAL